MKKTLLLLAVLLFAGATTTAQFNPILDPSFGIGGIVTEEYGADAEVAKTTILANGKILAVAVLTDEQTKHSLALQRYHPDGTPDAGFGVEGYMRVALPPILGRRIHQVEINPQDGSFFVCSTNNDNRHYAIGKFTPNGGLDPGFGQAGIVSEPANMTDSYTALTLLPNGKLLAGGFTNMFFNETEILITRLNTDGSRDTSFGINGKATLYIPWYQYVTTFALQADGKIIAAGYTTQMMYAPTWMFMVRLLPDGEIDSGFGFGGYSSGFSGLTSGVHVQEDGKVLLAGGQESNTDPRFWVIQRFMPDGTRDNAFGDMSVVSATRLSYELDQPRALILPDGKLLMYGAIDNRLNLFRYLPDGSVDTEYGDQGAVQTDFGMALGKRMLLLLQENKLLLFGDAGRGDIILGRCLIDGSIDDSFGQNGYTLSDFGSDAIILSDMTALSEDRLAVAIVTGQRVLMKRYLSDGTLDASYGSNGTAHSDLPPYTRYAGFTRIASDETGGMAVAVSVSDQFPFSDRKIYIYLVRFRPDGSIEQSFGNGGVVYLAYGPGDSHCSSLSILPDGKILVAGYGNISLIGIQSIALARLHADGSLDSTFGVAGVAFFPPANNTVWGLTTTTYPDGRILSAGGGFFEPFAPSQMVVARFLPDGQMDDSFGQSGRVVIDESPSFGSVEKITLQADGKILAAGPSGSTIAVFRLLENGNIDTGFGNMGAFRLPPRHYPREVFALSDGGVLLVNYFLFPSDEPAMSFLRLDATGTLVPGFGTNGLFITTPLPEFGISDAAYLPGNRVAVSGFSAGKHVLARYNFGPFTGIREQGAEAIPLLVWPNPAEETLHLEYTLSRPERLHIRLFDASGRALHTLLANAHRPEGRHMEQLRLPEGLPAGVYIVRVEAGCARMQAKVVRR